MRAPTRYLLLLTGALITLAWPALWAWEQSPYARFLSHHHLDELSGNGSLMLVFIVGWALSLDHTAGQPAARDLVSRPHATTDGSGAAGCLSPDRLSWHLDAAWRCGLYTWPRSKNIP